MITNTFQHITSIGEKTEQRLWANEIFSWYDFIKSSKNVLSEKLTSKIINEISYSFDNYENQNPIYFYNKLKPKHHWRLFPDFKNTIVYLDIETTGLYKQFDEITTIVLYDGSEIKYYINGQNLDEFKKDINNYKLIISYNGKCFDIPFIEEYFKIKLDHAHIDLRYVLNKLGYKGGLKGCEKQLGLDRGNLSDIDGFFAVDLWYEYKNNHNNSALETLLSYNIEDVINLEQLMIIAYNKTVGEYNLDFLTELKSVLKPQNLFQPNIDLVNSIIEKYNSPNYW